MDVLQRFGVYAAEFEKTYVDDSWARLRPHFADDAVYEVKARKFGCRLTGPDAILAGMKKSLDNFDRRFDKRAVEITSPPEVQGDEMRVGWSVTYSKAGLPDFVLRGRSRARVRDGLIVELEDSYEPAAQDELAAWLKQTGLAVNPAYT